MPNNANVSGISAAMGMLRPNTLIGARNEFIHGKQPHRTPSGIPIAAASEKPSTTRRKLTNRLRVSALSNQSLWN